MSTVGPALQHEGFDAESFEALADIAVRNIGEKRGLHVVCGPITSGGTGSQEYNFRVFNAAIEGLKRRGFNVFDQAPYEFGLRRLAQKWEETGNDGYCTPILDVFYSRVFGTGVFSDAWFLPGWNTSHGASWEFQRLSSLGCNLHAFLPREIRTFLIENHQPPLTIERIMRLLPKQ